MKKQTIILALFLIVLESLGLVYAYYTYLQYIAFTVGGLYLITAISDLILRNKHIGKFVIIISCVVTIPRLLLQYNEIVVNSRTQSIEIVKSQILPPTKREYSYHLRDCTHLPSWRGDLQVECEDSNSKQISQKNQLEEKYEKDFLDYQTLLNEKIESINSQSLSLVGIKDFAVLLLIFILTPIIPIIVLILLHSVETETPGS